MHTWVITRPIKAPTPAQEEYYDNDVRAQLLYTYIFVEKKKKQKQKNQKTVHQITRTNFFIYITL